MGPKWPKMGQNGQNLEIFPIFSFSWKCTKGIQMVSNGHKTHFNGMLTPFWPIVAGSPLHFGAPEVIWGSKMGSKGAKKAQNGQNLEIFPISRFGWKCTKMASK